MFRICPIKLKEKMKMHEWLSTINVNNPPQICKLSFKTEVKVRAKLLFSSFR